MNKKNCQNNPAIEYLEKTVIPLLETGLIATLEKIQAEGSLERQFTTLNGLDYLSEYLYNKNPNHPERSDKWLYIFDTPMAVASLKQKQRAYFPFSRVWSRNFAAIKIQAFWKGFLVRKRDDVQEMRQFWKITRVLKNKN